MGKNERQPKKTVLVVDDEPAGRELINRILSDRYTVYEAADGAMAIFIAHTAEPDVILMDIMMPVLDGFSACCAIKKWPVKNIPVLMLSATRFELDQKLCKDVAGADGYITKPFTPKELLKTVARVLSQAEKSPVN